MERKEFSRETPKAKVEVSFEFGVEQSLQKIREALTQQDEVLIAIYGSGINVGKTHLIKNIAQPLTAEGYKIAIADTTKKLETHRPSFLNEASQKGTVIFLENEGIPFRDVDIKIFIKRPDRPFHDVDLAYADIVINNADASDK